MLIYLAWNFGSKFFKRRALLKKLKLAVVLVKSAQPPLVTDADGDTGAPATTSYKVVPFILTEHTHKVEDAVRAEDGGGVWGVPGGGEAKRWESMGGGRSPSYSGVQSAELHPFAPSSGLDIAAPSTQMDGKSLADSCSVDAPPVQGEGLSSLLERGLGLDGDGKEGGESGAAGVGGENTADFSIAGIGDEQVGSGVATVTGEGLEEKPEERQFSLMTELYGETIAHKSKRGKSRNRRLRHGRKAKNGETPDEGTHENSTFTHRRRRHRHGRRAKHGATPDLGDTSKAAHRRRRHRHGRKAKKDHNEHRGHRGHHESDGSSSSA
jgi:hypothetical protein